ncbi:MAG: hypothetical protein JRF54_15240 [Deltaproteobacteria bacterium]|nr:hypothetical protein [Deltaproteobacteria bacterium]
MATKSSVRDQSTGTKFKAEPVSRVVPKIKGRERKEVQLLLERGRMQGHLTYDELNEALPPDMVTSDQIDDLMLWLKSEDIDVVDGAPEGQSRTSEAPVAATRSSVRRSATIPPPADDSYAQKSNDPVRMYLRKMGSVSLRTTATRRSRTTRCACTSERWGPFPSLPARVRWKSPSASKRVKTSFST